MTTYYFNGGITPAGLPFRGPHQVPMLVKIDIPDLIANGGLVDANGNALALPSTGFGDEDILKIPVNRGTMIMPAGVSLRQITAEGDAATIKVGCQTASQIDTSADDDGWMADADLNSTTWDRTAHDDGFGSDSFNGIMYITDGYIDVEFNTAETDTAVFELAIDAKEFHNIA